MRSLVLQHAQNTLNDASVLESTRDVIFSDRKTGPVIVYNDHRHYQSSRSFENGTPRGSHRICDILRARRGYEEDGMD